MAVFRTEEDWKRLVEEHQASGKPVKEFCTERCINPSRFYHKRKKLRNTGGFVLLCGSKGKPGTISIHIEGFTIELGYGWERAELSEVLRAVREACDARLP